MKLFRQLKFDKLNDVAAELEVTFLNTLGSLDLSHIAPTDDLQKLIQAHSVCSNIIFKSQNSVDNPINLSGKCLLLI